MFDTKLVQPKAVEYATEEDEYGHSAVPGISLGSAMPIIPVIS